MQGQPRHLQFKINDNRIMKTFSLTSREVKKLLGLETELIEFSDRAMDNAYLLFAIVANSPGKT